MAIERLTINGYGVVETNRVAFKKTGRIVSQTPLGAGFTKSAPAENGMILVGGDRITGTIRPILASDEPFPNWIGILYSEEKEYNQYVHGLNQHYEVAGDYGRLGLLESGDVVTSNCFAYDTTTFSTEADLLAALTATALSTTPMYWIPHTGGAPLLVASVPDGTPVVGKIIRPWTVPNGDFGLHWIVL